MSKVLIIKHLPPTLCFEDKEQLLKHFGAEQIWETSKKRDYIFASFSSIEKAKSSLFRLHQLEIAQRRLVVEYSFEKLPSEKSELKTEGNSITTNKIKDFLRVLNAWNPSVDFYQPPLHINYSYPVATTDIIINLIHKLFTHKPFYTQSLHLMNKMSLDSPFKHNEAATTFFKETFKDYFPDQIPNLPSSETESEISSDETLEPKQTLPSIVKRQHTLPKTRKRAAAVLSTATLPKSKKLYIDQKEIFDVTAPVTDMRKISLVVSQDALGKQAVEPEIIGSLGKFQKQEQPTEEKVASPAPELPLITRKELLKNKLSYREMKVLPVFKNYHTGEPSMRLYIKNLAKTVTAQDVKRIYKIYVDHIAEEDQLGFDVRVMQEGRMKGQGFVTFPSITIAENALDDTNGYLLKEKPMVVQFARVANKTTIK